MTHEPAVRAAEAREAMRDARAGALLVLCLSVAGCGHKPAAGPATAPVVGAWLVTIPEAPFPLHLFVFHADGTVEQSNPDAGDANSSDSNAMGAWRTAGARIEGKLIEVTADRATRQFRARGEIAFTARVSGNTLRGTAVATFYDDRGTRIRGPVQATLSGERVLP